VLQVVQEAATLANQLEQPATRTVIVGVLLEVVREVGDPLAKDRYLDFGGTGVRLVEAVTVDYRRLLLISQSRITSLFSRANGQSILPLGLREYTLALPINNLECLRQHLEAGGCITGQLAIRLDLEPEWRFDANRSRLL
jgi:hypothetical protein